MYIGAEGGGYVHFFTLYEDIAREKVLRLMDKDFISREFLLDNSGAYVVTIIE